MDGNHDTYKYKQPMGGVLELQKEWASLVPMSRVERNSDETNLYCVAWATCDINTLRYLLSHSRHNQH